MNERLRILRKALGFTLEKFGMKLGVKKNTVSQWENGKNITDQMFTSICNVNWDGKYVNGEWLRTGKGEMFKNPSNKALDQLKYDYGLTSKEYDFITEVAEKLTASQRPNVDNNANFAINSDINIKEIDTKSLAERVVAAEIEYEKSLGIVSKKSFAERVTAELEYIELRHCTEEKSVVSNTTIDTIESNAKIYKISNQQQKPDKILN